MMLFIPHHTGGSTVRILLPAACLVVCWGEEEEEWLAFCILTYLLFLFSCKATGNFNIKIIIIIRYIHVI